MTRSEAARLFALCTCLLSAMACGGDEKKEDASTPIVCARGTSFSCVGPGGCTGWQMCLSDGSAMTACTCNGSTAGSGGAGSGAALSDAAVGDGGGTAGTNATPTDGSVAGTGAGSDGSVPDGATSGAEICGNGIDDDGDDLADCADNACKALECVRKTPVGFAGPVVLYVGNDAPPDCEGAFAATAFDAGATPTGADATCTTCECTPSGGSCPSFLDFGTGSTSGCGGSTCTTSVSSSCTVIEPPCLASVSTAYLSPKSSGSVGTCEANTQTPSKAKAKFGKQVRGCSPTSAAAVGCDNGEVCVSSAAPPAGFTDGLCVWAEGDVACPDEGYTEKGVFYQDLVDTRTCSACSCDGPDCSMSWHVFASSDTTCSDPIVTLTSQNQCVQVNPSSDQLRVGVTITGNGQCAPSGGAPQGSVAGSNPITVCCAP